MGRVEMAPLRYQIITIAIKKHHNLLIAILGYSIVYSG